MLTLLWRLAINIIIKNVLYKYYNTYCDITISSVGYFS